MEELFGISRNKMPSIMFHIQSDPPFSMEFFFCVLTCIIQILLIIEVNKLFNQSNPETIPKRKWRHQLVKKTIPTMHSKPRVKRLPQKVEKTTRKTYYSPNSRKTTTRIKSKEWLIPQGPPEPSVYRQFTYDKIDELLSITPSEYMRRYKERKLREDGLKSCIKSLTILFEKTLNSDNNDLKKISRETLRKSINLIKENFEGQILGDPPKTRFPDFDKNSLHSLMRNAYNGKLKTATKNIQSKFKKNTRDREKTTRSNLNNLPSGDAVNTMYNLGLCFKKGEDLLEERKTVLEAESNKDVNVMLDNETISFEDLYSDVENFNSDRNELK